MGIAGLKVPKTISGDVESHMYEDVASVGSYVILNEWQNKEDFDAFLKSPAFGKAESSEFARLWQSTQSRTRLAVSILLIWVAWVDSEICNKEATNLEVMLDEKLTASEKAIILRAVREGQLSDLSLAFKIIPDLPEEMRRQVLELSVVIALSDSRLVTVENYVLRFIADLTGLGQRGLKNIFRELTDGSDFPEPFDASDPQCWVRREQASRSKKREHAEGQKANEQDRVDRSRLDYIRKLAILGLEEEATEDQIRSAFRRMTHIHHPDRYAALGPEAVAAAEASFMRIKAAYDGLVGR